MAGQDDNLLLALLRTQEELRVLQQEDLDLDLSEHDASGAHFRQRSLQAEDSADKPYTSTSNASVPEGGQLVLSPGEEAEDVQWADHARTEEETVLNNRDCPNGTQCLSDDFCYSWWDCEPCQWCENFQCVERNPDRECAATWECPCPPSEEQWYSCIDDRCALKCVTNEDCPFGEVCDPRDFYCKPGCENDAQCDPSSPDAAPDAKPKSFCVEAECVTPCEPPKLCKGPDDRETCAEGEVCVDKKLRAPGDPQGPIYECMAGCYENSDCQRCYTKEFGEGDDIRTEEFCYEGVCLEDQSCAWPCEYDSDCVSAFNEVCVGGACEQVGEICLSDADCSGENTGDLICNADGRCVEGCRKDSDCLTPCEPDPACVERCPPDPTCTCQGIYGEDACGTSQAEDWRDYCEPSRSCIESCPGEPSCEYDNKRNWTCNQKTNSCYVACNSDSTCPEGYSCVENEDTGIKSCQWTSPGTEEKVCEVTEICYETANGDIECVQEEECLFVSPHVDEDFYGCDCSETCTQGGQCAPVICKNDDECEDCSYCRDGVCIPGCDENNPCPPGECCQTDGKCHLRCSTDDMCPGAEMCLQGGCCGIACEPVVPCVNSKDCEEGERCNGDKICEPGCNADSDCAEGEQCYQLNCELTCRFDQCVSDSDCPRYDQTCNENTGYCELDCGDKSTCGPDNFCINEREICSNDSNCPDDVLEVCDENGDCTEERTSRICFRGYCEDGCRKDSDCGDGAYCIDGKCEFICVTNAECMAAGMGNECKINDDARRKAQQKYAYLKKTSSSQVELANWKYKSQRAGYCNSKGSTAEDPEEGRTGCYCWEICDENGRCERAPCETENDCECTSCLTDGKCGYCKQSADCPGAQVCDLIEECDANGENCVELDYGECNYTCMPDEACEADTDCPEGTFCFSDITRPGKSVCAPGCRNDGDCIPGEGCNTDNGKCYTSCLDAEGAPDPSLCNQETETCRKGICVYTGFRCGDDSDCPSNLGECYRGKCIEDKRCERDGDCSLSDVCTDGRCTKGERCDRNFDCQNTCKGTDDCKRRPGSMEECSSSSDCTSGQSCFPFEYKVDCDENGENCSTEWKQQCAFPPPVCADGYCYGEDPDESRFCAPTGLCEQGQACRGDGDCNFPDVCHNNVCQFIQRCSSSSQCPNDQYCNDGACELDNRCFTNEDCIDRFGPGRFCNASGQCQEEEKAESLDIGSGCPDDCRFFCNNDFRCEKIPCAVHEDCPCDVCNMTTGWCSNECKSDDECGQGCKCDKETKSCDCEGHGDDDGSCKTDADCDRGVCTKGECVECLDDPDCVTLYGEPGKDMVCYQQKCETPCYTGISDGDCFEGLFYGDLCKNCPDSCPGGAGECKLDGKVCGEYVLPDLETGELLYYPIECESCQKECDSDMDCRRTCRSVTDCDEFQGAASGKKCGEGFSNCPGGEICKIEQGNEVGQCENSPVGCDSNGYCTGSNIEQVHLCEYDEVRDADFCEYNNNGCKYDSDCQRWTNLDGQPRYCREKQCVVSNQCIGNSDCDDCEICRQGVCAGGPEDGPCPDCEYDSDCPVGYGCSEDGTCEYICGSDVQAFACRRPQSPQDPGIACPEGYSCNEATNLCKREGYDAIGEFMTKCAQGATCYNNVCQPIQKDDSSGGSGDKGYNCRQDSDCYETQGELCNPDGNTKWICPQYSRGEYKAGQCKEVFKAGYIPADGEGVCDGGPDERDKSQEKEEDICENLGKMCGPDGFCIPKGCDDENPCSRESECCDRESGVCVPIADHPNTAYGAPAQCSFDATFCEVLLPEGDDGTRNTISPLDFEEMDYSGCQEVENVFGEMEVRCWKGGKLSPTQITQLMFQECDPWENKEECDCEEIPTEDECFQDLDCGPRGKCESKTFKGDACCPVADAEGNDYQVWNICKTDGGKKGKTECLTNDDCTECETCVDAEICREDDRDCTPTYGTCTPDCDKLCPCGGPTSAGEECKTCEQKYGKHCVESYTAELGEESVDPETGEIIPAQDVCGCRIMDEKSCCEGFTSLEQVLKQRDGCLLKEFKLADGTYGVAQVNYCANFQEDLCAECTVDAHCSGSQKCRGYKCTKQCGDEDSDGFIGDCTCCTNDFECKELFSSWSETRGTGDGTETRACACTANGIDCQTWQPSESCYEWYMIEGGSGPNAKAERARIEEDLYAAQDRQAGLDSDVDEANIAVGDAQVALEQAKVEKEQACTVEPVCEDSVTAFKAACAELNQTQNFLQCLRNEMADPIVKDYNAQLELRDEMAGYMQDACPNTQEPDTIDPDTGEIIPGEIIPGETVDKDGNPITCDEATQKHEEAMGKISEFENETIPDQLAKIEDAEELVAAAQTEQDYWADQIREYCDVDNVRTDECIGYDVETTRPECREASQAVKQAQREFNNAVQNASDAEIHANNNLYRQLELERQLNESPYRPPVWGQRRTCPCCVDGQCRDEDECTYGTCYVCTMPPEDASQKDKYRAALWGKPNPEVEICVGCTDEQGNSLDGHKDCPDDAGGPSAIYFTEDGYSECVKYKCEDGINIHQEPCYGWQSSWFDYCVGGILGCLFSQDYSNTNINYWNGWDYTIACPLAGLWAYNWESDEAYLHTEYEGIVPIGGGNWVQLSGPKEINGEYPLINKSKCAYPNPLGHVQGNWLSPFPDLMELHPCCMKSQIFNECDPEYPDCNTPIELLFEAGDPTIMIERLKLQIRAIDHFVDQMDGLFKQLDDLEKQKKRELKNLNDALKNEGQNATNIQKAINKLEGDIADKEREIEKLEKDAADASEEYQEKKGELDEVSEERNGKIEERDDLQTETDDMEAYIELERQNATNARNEQKAKQGELAAKKREIEAKQDEMESDLLCCNGFNGDEERPCSEYVCDDNGSCSNQDVACPGDETIECYEARQELASLYEERDDLDALIEELGEAADGHTKNADDEQKEVDKNKTDIDNLQNDIDRLYQQWYVLNIEANELKEELDGYIADLNKARNDLVSMNEYLEILYERLENIEGTDGYKDDIIKAIEDVEEVLDNIENTRTEVENDRADACQAREEKQEEIDRLIEDYDIPEIPIASERPDKAKTVEQMLEDYKAIVEELTEKYQDRWYPET